MTGSGLGLVQTEKRVWTELCPFVQGVRHAGHENSSDYWKLVGV